MMYSAFYYTTPRRSDGHWRLASGVWRLAFGDYSK
jgi:hypothetical protein